MRCRSLNLGVVVMMVAAAANAQAAVIISQTDGNAPSDARPYFGQAVTTPTGGPWNNIKFSFDNLTGTGDANFGDYAAGDLFILTSSYLGTPAGLSNATPGFVAMSTGISGGMWTFASTVVLNPNTTYYFMMGDRPSPTTTSLYVKANSDPPGYAYSIGDNNNYLSPTNNDLNYRLLGDVAPEPASLIIWSMIGLCAGGAVYRRRRKAAWSLPAGQSSLSFEGSPAALD